MKLFSLPASMVLTFFLCSPQGSAHDPTEKCNGVCAPSQSKGFKPEGGFEGFLSVAWIPNIDWNTPELQRGTCEWVPTVPPKGTKERGKNEEKCFPCTFKGDISITNVKVPEEDVHFVKAWTGLNGPSGPPPQFSRWYGPPGPQGVTIPANGISCEYSGPPIEPPCLNESGPSTITLKVTIGNGTAYAFMEFHCGVCEEAPEE